MINMLPVYDHEGKQVADEYNRIYNHARLQILKKL
jgi:hypothetical protein